MADWTVDDEGYVRSPSGMKAGRFTDEAELEIMDKVAHAPIKISLLSLFAMWLHWKQRKGWHR